MRLAMQEEIIDFKVRSIRSRMQYVADAMKYRQKLLREREKWTELRKKREKKKLW